MRIALCFSGMMRTHETCLPTIVENVIKANPEHEFHSFMSVWLQRGRNPFWWETTKDTGFIDLGFITKFPELNLKSIRMDDFVDSDFMKQVERDVNGKYAVRKGEKCNPMNFIPMVKKIEQAHLLMLDNAATGVHYDCVVKIRSDLEFSGKMNFHVPEPKTVYMPEHECWGPGKLNDQLLYGNGDTMSYHASLYRNLDSLYEIHQNLHPETILHNYYQAAGYNVVRYPIPYRILR